MRGSITFRDTRRVGAAVGKKRDGRTPERQKAEEGEPEERRLVREGGVCEVIRGGIT